MELRIALHGFSQCLIQLFSARCKELDHLSQITLHVRILAAVQSVALHSQYIDHLTPTS